MSLLTPERVPVKVYKWDDAGAPQLDKTAGCVATIFKACLAIGYGTKEPAGWTMPFEDTATGVKVLRPEFGPHTDFFLRLSEDTGAMMTNQVCLNMTDANTGDFKLQCDTPFKYAVGESSGKWLLVASNRTVWFFCENRFNSQLAFNQTGTYFFCGDLSATDIDGRAVYLQHSGGFKSAAEYSSIFGVNTNRIDKGQFYYNYGKIMYGANNEVATKDISSFGDGKSVYSTEGHVSSAVIFVNNSIYTMPGAFTPMSGAVHDNFAVNALITGSEVNDSINFGTAPTAATNFFITIDEWVY